ncbi:MAG: hypothetical protein COB54_06670 [Alphaproteobacteria bacterium]|nr:MAG: hypothetical protein COB54_06670 [Alphaproteobacteria bacterium]
MLRISLLLLLILSPHNVAFSASVKQGDRAYLCFSHNLHPTWPEVFAYQVEILKVYDTRFKVEIVDAFPAGGRVNEEQSPVRGDIMKISLNRVYSKEMAGVQPGIRFKGKPVCSKLMGHTVQP